MKRRPNICSTRTSPPARSRPSPWSSTSAGAPMPSRRPTARALPPASSRPTGSQPSAWPRALAVIGDGARRLDGALDGNRDAARNRGGRGGGRGRRQARAGADRARAVRRDRGACHRMLPPTGGDAARRRARAARRSTRPRRSSSRRSRARVVSTAGWRSCPTRASRPATAASNGPTAASSATSAATKSAIDEMVARYISARTAPAA